MGEQRHLGNEGQVYRERHRDGFRLRAGHGCVVGSIDQAITAYEMAIGFAHPKQPTFGPAAVVFCPFAGREIYEQILVSL